MIDFPPLIKGDCENPAEVRKSHFEALVYLMDFARRADVSLSAIHKAVEAVGTVPAQVRELCRKVDELHSERRALSQWQRGVDAQLIDHKKDIDAAHAWKREHEANTEKWDHAGAARRVSALEAWTDKHDARLQRAEEQEIARMWELRRLFLSPAIAWGVAAVLGALSLGFWLSGQRILSALGTTG